MSTFYRRNRLIVLVAMIIGAIVPIQNANAQCDPPGPCCQPPPISVTLSSPVTGEHFDAYTAVPVAWSSSGPVQYVNVTFTRPDGGGWTWFGQPSSGSGSFNPSCQSGQWTISVQAFSNCLNATDSHSFVVDLPEPISVTLSSPVTGEHFDAYTAVPVAWSSSGPVQYVNVTFTRPDGGGWTWFGQPSSGSGSFNPSCQSGQWTISVQAFSNCLNATDSHSFVADLPSISSGISPVGGEQLLANAVAPITWSISGSVNNSIDLAYQYSGQTSWNTIASTTPNDGNHPWTVPDLALPSQARIRVTATPTCGGPAIERIGGYFTIVPSCDDAVSCTADLCDANNGQVVHPATCLECSESVPCPSGWHCQYGCCQPPDTCSARPCHIVYRDASNWCRSVKLCSEGECCVNGVCVPAGGLPCPQPDLLGSISLSLLDHGLHQVINLAQGFLSLTSGSPGFAYGMYDMPAEATFLVFDYQLINPAPDELLSISFGSQPLQLTSTATPPGEWVTAVTYVGNVAGIRDALTFALLPGVEPTFGDELLVRKLRVLGPGSFICSGSPGNGDGNGDGMTDGRDIQEFVAALFGGGIPYESYCPYDMNADGFVDSSDAAPFVDRLVSP